MAVNNKEKEYSQKVRNFLVNDSIIVPFESERPRNPKRIDEQVRKIGLENDALEQDIKLKKNTLDRLFWFLGIETIVIFFIALLQGWNILGFSLEEWSFKLIIAATLSQITFMLQVAVKHLFPNK